MFRNFIPKLTGSVALGTQANENRTVRCDSSSDSYSVSCDTTEEIRKSDIPPLIRRHSLSNPYKVTDFENDLDRHETSDLSINPFDSPIMKRCKSLSFNISRQRSISGLKKRSSKSVHFEDIKLGKNPSEHLHFSPSIGISNSPGRSVTSEYSDESASPDRGVKLKFASIEDYRSHENQIQKTYSSDLGNISPERISDVRTAPLEDLVHSPSIDDSQHIMSDKISLEVHERASENVLFSISGNANSSRPKGLQPNHIVDHYEDEDDMEIKQIHDANASVSVSANANANANAKEEEEEEEEEEDSTEVFMDDSNVEEGGAEEEKDGENDSMRGMVSFQADIIEVDQGIKQPEKDGEMCTTSFRNGVLQTTTVGQPKSTSNNPREPGSASQYVEGNRIFSIEDGVDSTTIKKEPDSKSDEVDHIIERFRGTDMINHEAGDMDMLRELEDPSKRIETTKKDKHEATKLGNTKKQACDHVAVPASEIINMTSSIANMMQKEISRMKQNQEFLEKELEKKDTELAETNSSLKEHVNALLSIKSGLDAIVDENEDLSKLNKDLVVENKRLISDIADHDDNENKLYLELKEKNEYLDITAVQREEYENVLTGKECEIGRLKSRNNELMNQLRESDRSLNENLTYVKKMNDNIASLKSQTEKDFLKKEDQIKRLKRKIGSLKLHISSFNRKASNINSLDESSMDKDVTATQDNLDLKKEYLQISSDNVRLKKKIQASSMWNKELKFKNEQLLQTNDNMEHMSMKLIKSNEIHSRFLQGLINILVSQLTPLLEDDSKKYIDNLCLELLEKGLFLEDDWSLIHKVIEFLKMSIGDLVEQYKVNEELLDFEMKERSSNYKYMLNKLTRIMEDRMSQLPNMDSGRAIEEKAFGPNKNNIVCP